MSLNKAIIIGRVGRDCEVRYAQSGSPFGNFSVATDESYKGKDGQKVEATEWHNVSCFGKTAEFAGNYVQKGRLVYVEGRIKTEKWTDKDGAEKYTTKIMADRIQLLDKRQDGQQPAPQQQEYAGRQEYGSGPSGMDDAPFAPFEAY